MPKASPASIPQPQNDLEKLLAENGSPFDFKTRQELWEIIRWNPQEKKLGDSFMFKPNGRPLPQSVRDEQNKKLLEGLKKDAAEPRIIIVDKKGNPTLNFDLDIDSTIRVTLKPLPQEAWEISHSLKTSGQPLSNIEISEDKPIAELGNLDSLNENFFVRAKWKYFDDELPKVRSRDMFAVMSPLKTQNQCTLDQSQILWEANDVEEELPESSIVEELVENLGNGLKKLFDTIEDHPEVWTNVLTEKNVVTYLQDNVTSLAWVGTVCTFSPILPVLSGWCLPMGIQTVNNFLMALLKNVVDEAAKIRGVCIPTPTFVENCFTDDEKNAILHALDLGDAIGQAMLSPPSDPKKLKRLCSVLDIAAPFGRVMAPRFWVNFIDPDDPNVKRAHEISINMLLQGAEKITGVLCKYSEKL